MKIGLAKEIKPEEYRVGLTPQSAREYIDHGHEVSVETGAGIGSGFTDGAYAAEGCRIQPDKVKLFAEAEMIIKVKEPVASEYGMFRKDQILFTYLHLAANRSLTDALLAGRVSAVAYETVMESDGSLPLLIPMSQVAGRLSVQEGAKYLEKPFGGRGVLLGGVPGSPKGRVVILGGGTAGTNACKIALGMGADVTVLDVSAKRLRELDREFNGQIHTLHSTPYHLESSLRTADLLIGAVLVPGASAPKLIRVEDLKKMKEGAVFVDIAVDQGGCAETTRPTTHGDPVYVIDGVVHYCVANMPGAVSLTSTLALTSVTNRYGLLIADLGLEKAAEKSEAVKTGINCARGRLTNRPVADAHGYPYEPY